MNKNVSWVRQLVVWLLVLAISVTFIGEAQAGEQSQKMTGAQLFNDIQNKVADSASNVLNYKAPDAYQIIDNALQRFKKLRTTVENATYIDNVIETVASELDAIATDYETVSNYSPDIKQQRRKVFSQLEDDNRVTSRTEEELKQKINKLEFENNSIQQQAVKTTDKIDLQMLEVGLKGNESIINSLKAESEIWDKFYLEQKKLLESLNLNGRKIDLLLYVLEVNAKVYREAANVARLRHNAKTALESLHSLKDIQGIINDVQDSWFQVNDLVNEISTAEFNFDLQ